MADVNTRPQNERVVFGPNVTNSPKGYVSNPPK